MSAVIAQRFAVGSYCSLLVTTDAGPSPPATRTWPFASNVALNASRPLIIGAAGDQLSVAGSNS
jgi:hypothetical protein